MKKNIFVLIILVVFSLSAISQEKADDMFRWFPGRDFNFIAHYDLDKISDENYNLLIKANPVSQYYHYQKQNYLPESMLKLAWSFTCGKVVKIKTVNQSIENPDKTDFVNSAHNGMQIVTRIGDYNLEFTEQGYMVQVYRFDDLEEALKIAVSEGHFQKLKKEIGGYKVYTYLKKAPARKVETTFYLLAHQQELLVAPALKALEQMYEAGIVSEESFIGSEKYQLLKDHLDEFGSAWTYFDQSLIRKAVLEKQIEFQDSIESIERAEKDIEAAGEFTIKAVIIDDQMKLMEFRVFKDTATAQKYQTYDHTEWKRKNNLCYNLIDTRDLSKKKSEDATEDEDK